MNTRAGFVAIIGAPNAGKSTLTNALVGEKVSIVTHKVQTTRFQVRGIAMLKTAAGEEAQVVLVDTPGIFAPKETDRLAKSMVHAAWTGVGDSDAIVHVVDAPAHHRQKTGEGSSQDRLSVEDTNRVVAGLKLRGQEKVYLALNKIDEMPHDLLLEQIDEFNKLGVYAEIFIISALNLDGVDTLSKTLAGTCLLYTSDAADDS